MNIHITSINCCFKMEIRKKEKKKNMKMWVFLIGSSTPLLKVVVCKIKAAQIE